jgi:ABC-type branched-subunit amino acid transport system substrate-binding protein
MNSFRTCISFCLLCTTAWQQVALADGGRRIGAILGLTGPSSIIGQEIRQGMELCTDSDSELLVEDSQGLPASG